MKGFYGSAAARAVEARPAEAAVADGPSSCEGVAVIARHGMAAAANVTHPRYARIAVYDAMTSSPRVEDISSEDPRSLIETLSERTYTLARERGGRVPYTVVREVTENLVHASFSDVVVSILDDGATIRFSDRGPGIGDKDRAFLPGFTTANDAMRRYIRGVGSGLPIVRESVGFSGGFVEVEDNLGAGTVVTINVPSSSSATKDRPIAGEGPASSTNQPSESGQGARDGVASGPDLDFADENTPVLGVRQKQVLSLVMEMGCLGPTIVSRELKVGLSTAYRDLAFLEEAGLLSADSTGKRVLTDKGIDYLDSLTG